MPKVENREELMQLCLDGIVAEQYWSDRDSAKAMMQLGQAYALLKAGCNFDILRKSPETDPAKSPLVTDDKTIWISVQYKGFDYFEESVYSHDTFYIPTRARLNAAMVQRDWY